MYSKQRLQKLAGLLTEVQRVNPIVKIIDKTCIECPEYFGDFLHRHCGLEFGAGSECYDKLLIDVVKDFNTGEISFATDHIYGPKSQWNGNDWEDDDEELATYNELISMLGDNHYFLHEDMLIQYDSNEDNIEVWGLPFAEDENEDEATGTTLAKFDTNGNIIFNLNKMDVYVF